MKIDEKLLTEKKIGWGSILFFIYFHPAGEPEAPICCIIKELLLLYEGLRLVQNSGEPEFCLYVPNVLSASCISLAMGNLCGHLRSARV